MVNSLLKLFSIISLTFLFIFFLTNRQSAAFAQLNRVEQNNQISSFEQVTASDYQIPAKLFFSYFVNINGPTLGGNYAPGATYDRFESGTDSFGKKKDATHSISHFHSAELGTTLGQDFQLSASFASTYRTHDKIKYQYKIKNQDVDWNGPAGPEITKEYYTDVTDERNGEAVALNPRLNFYHLNVINGPNIFLNHKYSYEFPTSQSSQDEKLLYAIAYAPILSFNLGISPWSIGLTGNFQFNYFSQNVNVSIPDKTQCYFCETSYYGKRTFIGSVGHFLNYTLNDTWLVKTWTNFDWDQIGTNSGTTNFGSNLDDVFSIGLGWSAFSGGSITPYLQTSLNDTALSNSILGLQFAYLF
jgi:hypothetical protein